MLFWFSYELKLIIPNRHVSSAYTLKFSNSQFSIQGTTGAEGDFFGYHLMREKVVGYYLIP